MKLFRRVRSSYVVSQVVSRALPIAFLALFAFLLHFSSGPSPFSSWTI